MSSNENTSVPIIDATLPHDRPNEMASSVDEIISNSFQSFLPNTDNNNLEQTTTNSTSTTPINGITSSSSSSGSRNSSSTNNSITSLGYCHVCNRQIRINLESFTCTQCNGGFIELFDINETNNNDSLPLLDSELLTNNLINPMTRINTDPIQTSRTDATRTHTPLIQLFRRYNNRSTRLSSPIVNTHETLPDLIENPNYIDNNYPLASSLDPTHTATTTTNTNNSRNSFHYRLRRHTNSNTSTNSNNNSNNNSNSSPNNYSTLFASSSSPSSARHHHHHHHHHRHRFHRSPNSRFHFNFLDDDEILNDHGAIIITTLINQLRNTNRGAAPASETQIETLPVINIDQELVEKTAQCAICMDEYSLNEKVKQLPCKHLFHDPCIVQWLKLHATCPVCRKNISGLSEQDQELSNEQQERTNLLNIFPITTSVAAAAAAGVSTTSRLNSSSISRESTNLPDSSSATSTNRRPIIGNRHIFRIHIRQSSSNNNNNNNNSGTLGSNTSSDPSLRLFRSRHIATSPSQLNLPSSSSLNDPIDMNPFTRFYSNLETNDLDDSLILSSSNNQNRDSAFSFLNDFGMQRSNESSNHTSNNNNNNNTTEGGSSAANNNNNNNSSSSRISHYLDRIINRCRPNLANRNNPEQQQQHDQNSFVNPYSTRSGSRPTASRFSRFFTGRRNNFDSNTSNLFTASESLTSSLLSDRYPSSLSSSSSSSSAAPGAATAAAANPNRNSDLFEYFRIAPLRTSMRRHEPMSTSSNSLSSNDIPSNTTNQINNSDLTNTTTATNNNASNNTNTSSATTNQSTNLLGELFDLTDENNIISNRRRLRSQSPNTITISIDDDEDDDDDDDDISETSDEDDDETLNENTNINHQKNVINNNISSNSSNDPIILDSDNAIESSVSNDSANLNDTIDLVSSQSLQGSTNNNSTAAVITNSIAHAAKKRKTEST